MCFLFRLDLSFHAGAGIFFWNFDLWNQTRPLLLHTQDNQEFSFIQVNSIYTAPFLSKEYCCYLYCSTTNNAHHHGVLLTETDTVDSCFTGADDSERSGKCVGRHVRPLVDKAKHGSRNSDEVPHWPVPKNFRPLQ